MGKDIPKHLKGMGTTVLDNLRYYSVCHIYLQRTIISYCCVLIFFVIYNLTFLIKLALINDFFAYLCMFG